MPAPFGFSVGDVIAGIGVLLTAYDAIKSSGGAASRYQQHIIWLNQLIEVLEKLRLETDDTVPQLAEELKVILVAFKETIEAKYQTHLGAGGKKGKWLARRFRQLQWAFLRDAENDLVKLRNDIQPQLTAIGLHLDVQVKSAVRNVQMTTNESLIAVEALSNAVDRGFHDIQKLLEALPGQIAAQSSTIDGFQHSIVTSATILTETRTIAEETRDTLVQIKSTAPSLLKNDQYDDASGLPPFVLACMKRAMSEVLKEHQQQLSSQEETSDTSWPTMHTDLPLGNQPLPEHIPSTSSNSQTNSHCTAVSTRPNTSRTVKSTKEPGITIENERAKTYYSARQLNLWFGTLFTWTRTDVVDDDKPTYSSVIRITKTTYYFWPAKWFSTTGAFLISEIVHKAFRKPEVKYLWETYRVVPKDSPIIQACVNLNLPQIQYLFSKRLASPFDRDERGSSLFDYCAAVLRHPLDQSELACITTKLTQIAEYLILCGADVGQYSAPVKDSSACVYTISGHFFGLRSTTFCHLLILYYLWTQVELITLVRLIVDSTQTDPFDDPGVQSFLTANKIDWTKPGIPELSSYMHEGHVTYMEVYEPAMYRLNSESELFDLRPRELDLFSDQDIHDVIERMSVLYELRKGLSNPCIDCDGVTQLKSALRGQHLWSLEGMPLATQLVEDHGLSDSWGEALSDSRDIDDGQVYKQWRGVQYIKLPKGDLHRLGRIPESYRGWFGYGPHPILQLPVDNRPTYRWWLQCSPEHQL